MTDAKRRLLTIFIIIINGEIELLNESYDHRPDPFKKLLSITWFATIVALQYNAWLKIRLVALDDSNHVLNSSDGSLDQFLLNSSPTLLGSLKLPL